MDKDTKRGDILLCKGILYQVLLTYYDKDLGFIAFTINIKP